MLLHIYHLLMCRSTRWYRNQLRKRERRFLQPKVKPNCNSDHSPSPHFPTVQQWGSSAPKSVSNQNIEITQLFPIGMGQTLKAFTTIYDTTKSKDYNGGIGADVTSYDNKGLTMVLDASEIKSPRMCQIFFLALGI